MMAVPGGSLIVRDKPTTPKVHGRSPLQCPLIQLRPLSTLGMAIIACPYIQTIDTSQHLSLKKVDINIELPLKDCSALVMATLSGSTKLLDHSLIM